MTNAILRGKPDAGNPYVRFDEGEVAPAKPRRGSLLYKRLMLTIGISCCSMVACADADSLVELPYGDYAVDGLRYAYSGGTTVAVKGYSVTPDDVTIPAHVILSYKYVSGYDDATGNPIYGERTLRCTVTKIADRAFFGCQTLKSVEFPSTLTVIGECAFSRSGLTSVTVPSGLEDIGESIFSSCEQLKKMTIADGVRTISADMFALCTSLKSVTIPSSVTEIGDWAFSDCESLEKVTIGSGVDVIENGVFSSCYALTSVEMSQKVKRIGEGAFAHCHSLCKLPLPSALTSIGEYAFNNCLSAQGSIEIPSGVTAIEDGTFACCEVLTAIGIPTSITYIGEEAFVGCKARLDFKGKPPKVSDVVGDPNLGVNCIGYFRTTYVNEWMAEISNGLWHDIPMHCEDEYMVHFNANGGDGDMDDIWIPRGYKFILPLNAFTRKGYSFGGWSYSDVATLANLSDGQKTSGSLTSFDEITLYAFWKGNTINVTFDRGPFSDTAEPTKHKYVVGTAFHNFPICTRTGWNVRGWYTQPVGGDRYRAGDVLPFTEDGTLYLQADYIGGDAPEPATTYTVTFVLGEHGTRTGGGELTQSVADGAAAVEPSFTVANGWSFTGWSSDFSKVTGDLTVYAQWKRADGVYSEYANGILWTYTVDNGIALLYEVENSKNRASIPTNTVGRVVIPSQFGGCTLRTIGRHAFWHCERMTEVEIPETVRTIQTAAFWECNALQNVVIPEGVKSVGYGAFHGCESLVSALIPKTATLLGNGEHGNPFIGCPKLADLTVRDGNEKYKVSNGMILTMDGKTVVVVPGSWVNVVVPDGVEELARSAIIGYDVLSSLTLPESLVRITNGIGSCRKLGRLVIPASVSELGCDAFGLLGLETIIEFKGKPPTAIEDVSSSVRSATYSNQYASEWIQVIDQNGYWKGLALVRQEGTSARVSVVFDANGGDMPVTTINFELGEKYGSLPTATREHYEFCGWAVRSTAQLGDTLVGNESIVLASVRKLYAVWEELPTFTVIFNLGEHGVHAGGGELVQTVELWNAAVAPNVKAMEGWEFIGWSGGDFSRVWNNLVVAAQYKKVEQLSEIHSLSPGWNWISLNVTPTNSAIGSVFAGVTFADEDVIKSAEGSATYYGGKWYGELTTIMPGVAYRIKKSTAGSQTLTVAGSAAATSVDVVSGWNWIGSTATAEVSLDALTHSGGFTDEDVIKSAEASATYYGGKWYGELKALQPGVGYGAKFAKGGTLTFGEGDL